MVNRGQHHLRLVIAFLLVFAVGVLSVGAQAGGQTIASQSGAFSVELPAGWVSEPITQQYYRDFIVFGSSSAALQYMRGQVANATGVGGYVGQIDLSQAQPGSTPASFVQPVIQSILENLFNKNVQTQSQAYMFGGQYSGTLVTSPAGYVGAFATDTDVFALVIITDNLAANQASMMSIVDGIRVRGGAAPAVEATKVNNQPIVETQTVRSSDKRVSLDIPAGWTVVDRVADQNVLAYGDSAEAAQSRLSSAKPDLVPKTDITGIGGLIILYPAANFNVDPKNPDLNALMTQLMQQLEKQGYTTEAPQATEGRPGGLVTYIDGTEVGYLALVPFGDQIAYLTATGTKATADAADDELIAILKSVQSPAKPAATGGLGGLGGLGSATPEATAAPLGGLGGLAAPAQPSPTAPPLGGLGGLGAPAATAEASS